MTNQEVFDAALAEFRKESLAVIWNRDLMVVNQREMARTEMEAEQLPQVVAGSNATARAALKAAALEKHAHYAEIREAHATADREMRQAQVNADVARYTMRMAIAAEGATNDE